MNFASFTLAVNRALLAETPRNHAPSFEDRCQRCALREIGYATGLEPHIVALLILEIEGVEQATFSIEPREAKS
jgi:hypothetical protein